MSPVVQHQSHRGLVPPSAPEGRAPVDAVIVPSARRPAVLAEAARVAEELECVLLVICSGLSRAADVAARWDRPDSQLVAVDLPWSRATKLPQFETSAIAGRHRLTGNGDIGAKRNLALVVAKLAGWRHVVFLDDDISVPDVRDLERAAAALASHDGVGLHVLGFPDNSVVCHANRAAGASQDTFIGGGALAVSVERIDSFFPDIYNEDWFFLLGERTLGSVARVGAAFQEPYDPFASPERARREEFGDVLAEGIFALFDNGRTIGDAGDRYWTAFLAARLSLIESIERGDLAPDCRDQILVSLRASRRSLGSITAGRCVSYLEAWQRDRERWRRFIAGVTPIRRGPSGATALELAIEILGLWVPPPRPKAVAVT